MREINQIIEISNLNITCKARYLIAQESKYLVLACKDIQSLFNYTIAANKSK